MNAGTIRCDRCQRRYRGTGGWNVTMAAGVPIGYLCPDCQSPAENAEAEINQATTAYAIDDQRRMVGRPKVGGGAGD